MGIKSREIFLLETSLISKKKKCESLEIISTYSNEITYIQVCMKLHVNMCMKLERHKYSTFFLKGPSLELTSNKFAIWNCLFYDLRL